MSPRERFLTTLNHKEPDRVPTFTNLTLQIAEKLGKKMNLPWEAEDSWLSTRISHTEILLELGNDAVGVGPLRDKYAPTRWEDGRLIDEFGFVYKRVGLYDEIIKRPLADVETAEEVNKFKMPDSLAPGRWDLAEKQIRRYKENFAIVGDLETTIFELSWYLVGMEKFLMDLVMEKPYVLVLMNKVLEYQLACGKKMVELGVDEQGVLPFGNTAEVKGEVKLRIAQAGKKGGFIIAPSHNIQPDTPLENIYAYFKAIKKYGAYPLSL